MSLVAVKSDPLIVFISFVFTNTSFRVLCFLSLEMIWRFCFLKRILGARFDYGYQH